MTRGKRLTLAAFAVGAGILWGALLDPTRWWLGLIGLTAGAYVATGPHNNGGK